MEGRKQGRQEGRTGGREGEFIKTTIFLCLVRHIFSYILDNPRYPNRFFEKEFFSPLSF